MTYIKFSRFSRPGFWNFDFPWLGFEDYKSWNRTRYTTFLNSQSKKHVCIWEKISRRLFKVCKFTWHLSFGKLMLLIWGSPVAFINKYKLIKLHSKVHKIKNGLIQFYWKLLNNLREQLTWKWGLCKILASSLVSGVRYGFSVKRW